MTNTKQAARAQAFADMAQEMGTSVEYVETEIDAAKRAVRSPKAPKDYGYSQRLEDIPTTPMARPTGPAVERMREVANVIPRELDACVTLTGAGEIVVSRVVKLASSEALEGRYQAAIERAARADKALNEALRNARAFAAHSAAQSRASAASTAVSNARKALEAARALMGSDSWEAQEATEELFRRHWSRTRAGMVKRDVVPTLYARRDVMPLGMRDALRPDPDFQPSDPVGNRVVRDIVDTSEMVDIVTGVLEALAIIREMRHAARAEAKAESKRRTREAARAERAANIDPAMARLANSSRRRR